MGNHLMKRKIDIEIKSSNNSNKENKLSFLQSNDERMKIIVNIMMPLYYTTEPVSKVEINELKDIWINIENNNINNYSQLKKSGRLRDINSCQEWFHQLFFDRLYYIHPICKPLFKSKEREINFIEAFFSFIYTALDGQLFYDKLQALAESHCQRGVKACEYSVIGDVMVWTFRKILGDEFNYKIYNAWVKLFSILLSVMVPISVKHEYNNNESQLKRFNKFDDNNYKVNSKRFQCPFSSMKFKIEPESFTEPSSVMLRSSANVSERISKSVSDLPGLCANKNLLPKLKSESNKLNELKHNNVNISKDEVLLKHSKVSKLSIIDEDFDNVVF